MLDRPALSVRRLSKSFISGKGGRSPSKTMALSDVSFDVPRGESVTLLGASGSGKSTLIRILCGLETPDVGCGLVEIDGNAAYQQDGARSRADLIAVRSCCGVIFQQFNLVGQLSVLDNVMIGSLATLPLWRIVSRQAPDDLKARAIDCLRQVGLADRAYQRASTLSGGQQQRVAVARALVKGAKVILADEPVASLDPASSVKVMEILVGLAREFNITLLVSLHQTDIAKRYCSRALALRDGQLVFDGSTRDLSDEKLRSLYGPKVEELLEERLSPTEFHSNRVDFAA